MTRCADAFDFPQQSASRFNGVALNSLVNRNPLFTSSRSPVGAMSFVLSTRLLPAVDPHLNRRNVASAATSATFTDAATSSSAT